MNSAGLELTKLTYTRLDDNLIRHRGDRYLYNPDPNSGQGYDPFDVDEVKKNVRNT